MDTWELGCTARTERLKLNTLENVFPQSLWVHWKIFGSFDLARWVNMISAGLAQCWKELSSGSELSLGDLLLGDQDQGTVQRKWNHSASLPARESWWTDGIEKAIQDRMLLGKVGG